MLKRMILINSANFQFADIDLSKEIFFVGDNASGKTTTTRALHFLYNGDGQKLGIPRSKDTFLKHYFSHDDSYIIYVFDSFFIFTYVRNNTIRRWFSKQVFDITKVIKDKQLLEFKEIESYIKLAPLRYKPTTIEEYIATLYGENKKYLDFSIAKIQNHKIFLELFNMIFNIDKAIVTASDIKRAIQKSLDRKDETLSIDYEDFIRRLNGFSSSYHFFKILDSVRGHLKNALEIKDELLGLEQNATLREKAINYRYGFELGEFNKIEDSIKKINEMVKKQKDKIKSVETLFHSFEKKVDAKKERLTKEITKLELLKEEFNPLELEENISNASKYDGVLKDLDAKKYSRLKLQEEQTSALKELEQEIEQLEYKIKNTIPNEVRKIIYNLEEMERNEHQSRRVEIEKEFENLEAKNSDVIKKYDAQIEELKSSKNSIESKVFDEQRDAKERYEKEIKKLEFDKKTTQDTLEDRQNKISKLKIKKRDVEFELDEHEKKYKKLRAENAKELASKKRFYDNKIANAKAILYPPKNSLNEFLSNEIDGWEESVYPIIDKDLLKRSCDELNPQVIDATNPIGFKLDTKTLSHIPTKDEALKQIEDAKYAKRELLRNSKEVYKTNISNLDEKKNEIISNLESCKKEIDNLIDESSKDSASLEKIYNDIKDKTEKLKVELDAIESKYKKSKDELLQKMHSLENLKKEMRDESQKLSKEKQKEFAKNDEIRDFNLNAIRKKETSKGKEEIKKVQDKIDTLNTQKKSLDENEMIYRLSKEINLLEKQMKIITDAIRFLEKYDEHKDEIEKLPLKQSEFSRYKKYYDDRKELVFRVVKTVDAKIASLNDEKNAHESRLKKYDVGIKKVQTLKLEIGEEMLECEEFLVEIIEDYENILSEYRTKKSKFRELIDRLKKLESHSIIELNFNLENFSEVKSIGELDNILDSLSELDSFEKNKYESEKKRAHNNFDSFLRNTIPSKLQSFDDLENEFEKAKNSINKSLSNADFGVIKEIRLVMDSLKNKNDSIASLLQELSKKVRDTTNLYSNKSLFYFDVAKSVGNIEDIKNILEEVKKKGSNGSINLFDTIDLSISYVENGRKVENKLNIKDESSSGGNILLKVAIAMSILNRYAKKTTGETPFFLIIDEVSKLQSKNQELIRSYINENGFKTLFITPDPAYPDPKRAIYYTFKNIQEEGEHLEIRQMNII